MTRSAAATSNVTRVTPGGSTGRASGTAGKEAATGTDSVSQTATRSGTKHTASASNVLRCLNVRPLKR